MEIKKIIIKNSRQTYYVEHVHKSKE